MLSSHPGDGSHIGRKESAGTPGCSSKAACALARLVPLKRRAFNLDLKIDVRDLSDEQLVRLLEQSVRG